ncbi:MAG TPA: AsmA family protein [Bryobacteraceae bacterium]|nr:AsmA family protein [Bryobacteraceae bacterium]
MKRNLKWAAIGVALLLVGLLSAPFWIDPNSFRPMLEADLSKALGRAVKVGVMSLDLFSGSVSANDLSVADDPIFNRTPFVRANSMNLEIELRPLIFSHKLNVTGLTIDRPDIILVQAPSGDWNFSKLGAPSGSNGQAVQAAGTGSTPPAETQGPPVEKSPLQLSIKLIKITGGRLSVGRRSTQQPPVVLEDLNAEVRDFSNTSVFPFIVSMKVGSGGSIDLKGKAGPINPSDAAETPVQASLNITQLNVAGSSLGIRGLVSFEGSGESKGSVISATGKVKAEKLQLARQGAPTSRLVELDFAVQHDLRKQSGTVSRGDIHIGQAVAHLTGTYSREGDDTVLKMALSGGGMPIPELAAMLPAMGVVLPAGSSLEGGTANARFDLQGPANRLITSGSLSFDHARLKGFDLGKKMSVIEKLAGIQGAADTEIQTLSANLRVAAEGMTASDVKLIVPTIGEMNGGGTVSPANALAFKMTAAVHTGGMAAAMNDRPIPFVVEGTCSDPVFRPDMKAVAATELKGLESKTAGSLMKGLLGGKKK